MTINIEAIRDRCSAKIGALVAVCQRRREDGGDPAVPMYLLEAEATYHVRMIIRNAIRFDPMRIPQYIQQFPDLLKSPAYGRTIEEGIEAVLISTIQKPIMPTIVELLLDQYEGQTLDDVVKAFARADIIDGDERLAVERSAYRHAWNALAERPDRTTLCGMMFHARNLADRAENLGIITLGSGPGYEERDARPYVLRLREIHDFLDLLLEKNGFDEILDHEQCSPALWSHGSSS